MSKSGVFTQSSKEKYDGLPKNFKSEINTVFEEKTGKQLKPYLHGISFMTPRQVEVFDAIVDQHVDTYKSQLESI
jgi:hypothetical protein